MRKLVLYLSVALGIGGCTKEAPFEELPKQDVLPKNLVQPGGDLEVGEEFIYVPSYLSASRTGGGLARPFWMGDAKLVRFRFTENSLQVLETEQDPRYKGNIANSRLVIEIPVSHHLYKCAEDKLGECTNREEDDATVAWKDRPQFKPNFTAMKIGETSTLPIELYKALGLNCYSEVGNRLKSYNLNEDGLYVEIEKSFRVGLECLGGSEGLNDTSVQVTYAYSFVRESRLARAKYAVVDYPSGDENTFGFFTTEYNILDPDNRDVVKGKRTLLNRWDPRRGEIVYDLSAEFAKPENASILAATRVAVDRINRALGASQAGLRILLQDPAQKSAGDIRNSMIVLVEDPVSARVIGYGPSVAHPRTGEILSGRTVMYLGTIKQTIRSTYEEIRLEREKESRAQINGTVAQLVVAPELLAGTRSTATLSRGVQSSKEGTRAAPALNLNLGQIKKALDPRGRIETQSSLRSQLDVLSHHCQYPADMVNFHAAVEDGLKLLPPGPLKPWEELDDSEKQKMLDILVPFVWVPTLVHELGHNLGLRHNFQGSEDAANFYTAAELEELGIDRAIPYSSVMDYAYSETNVLPTMGRYDIAALRFAYARQVETAKGEMVPVPRTLADVKGVELKEFLFCTDEHVSANPGCKRFDEGTSLAGIIRHTIQKNYHEAYRLRNFRNGLRHFSLLGDAGYAARIEDTLRTLRLAFETHERIRHDFQIPLDHPVWTSNPFLKDLQEAVNLGAQALMEILRTPDTTCAVASASEPNKIVGVAPIRELGPRAVSCFDSQNLSLNPAFVVVAEGGRSFQSRKAPTNDNPYVDQIDVRGIWVDKVVALNLLLQRQLGSPLFDKYTDNYGTLPRVRSSLVALLTEIARDDLRSEVEFAAPNGQKLKIPLRYNFGLGVGSGHMIPAPLDSSVGQELRLVRAGNLPFLTQVLAGLKRDYPSPVHVSDSTDMIDRFSVLRALPVGSVSDQFESLQVGSLQFFAAKGVNTVAESLIQEMKKALNGTDQEKKELKSPDEYLEILSTL